MQPQQPQQPCQQARASGLRLQRNGRVTNSPLFLPERDPILASSSTTINVDSGISSGSSRKESSINKYAWWWKYFDVRLLDSKFLKGKKNGKKEEVWDEYWSCNINRSCDFNRYASRCHTATTALKDHVELYHHIKEDIDLEALNTQNDNSQGDIRTFLSGEVDSPSFEDTLLDWITYTNKPFNITKSKWFRRMIRAGRVKHFIPKADIVRNRLEARVDKVAALISADIKATASTVCLTLDSWTSQNNLSILAINIRWLDNNFFLCQHSIEFIEIQGSHSGENMAHIVHDTLKRHSCCPLLLTITGDNTDNNNTLCAYLHSLLLKEYNDYLDEFPTRSGETIRFQGNQSRIHCFAHILNLIVKKILEVLGSSTQKSARNFLDTITRSIAEGRTTRLSIPLGQGVITKLRLIIL